MARSHRIICRDPMQKLENRSLDRGITIMETLARNGASSLADLHRECALPKSTIRRLLATLMRRRLVRRSLADQLYRINITLAAGSGEPIPANLALLIDVAMPHAVELTRKISWPSDIHIVDNVMMRIVESTRPLSPFHLYRGVVNRRISLFGSATGMVCLSAMQDEEILQFHRQSEGDEIWGLARFNLSFDKYLREIEATRKRGYGVRYTQYLGETVLDDGLAAIAVPLHKAGKPFGGMTVLWPRVFKKHEEFAAEFLSSLREAASRIDAELQRYT